jgi:hypothetical protein
MENKELAPGIVIYKNIILPCINEIMLIDEWSKEYVLTLSGQTLMDNESRSTSSVDIPHSDLSNNFTKVFRETFDPVEKNYFSKYSISPKSHNPYKILKYNTGDKFDDHMDDGGGNFRRVSTVYYLNDNYEGGQVVFPRFNLEVQPEAGDMLIFPSSYAYNHSVKEVKSGIRYSIASWIR